MVKQKTLIVQARNKMLYRLFDIRHQNPRGFLYQPLSLRSGKAQRAGSSSRSAPIEERPLLSGKCALTFSI